MREQLKKIAHSNRFFEGLLNFVRKIQYYYIPVAQFNKGKKRRTSGKKLKDDPYSKLKTLKDTHVGERCFVVCTGPSLTKNDLNSIKNEYTFGMNSIAMVDDWKPTFFGIQDMFVYKKMPEYIHNMSKIRPTFVTSDIYKADKSFCTNPNVYLMPVYCSDHLINPESNKFEFSKDCYVEVHDGFSITISLIQIAYYMGFREIYLIGADSNYSKDGQNHFIEYGHRDPYAHKSTNRNIRMYQKVKEFADNNGLKVINATRGGMLEVFPRINIDEMDLK